MRIWKFIKIAYRSIAENKFRSFLTMLGMIIGVGSVILMTSIGKGAESLILGSVSSFGSNLIYIQPGSGDMSVTSSFLAVDTVKYRDYSALKRLDYVENVTPMLAVDGIITYGNKNFKTQVIGTTNGYAKALNYNAAKGRFVEDYDNTSRSKVVVLGYKVVDELFGEKDPVGGSVNIKNQTFQVIGVMEKQGGNAFEDYDSMVFIPITSMQSYLNGVDYVNTIMLGARGDVLDTIDRLRTYMRRLHNLDNPDNDLSKDDFNILSQEQALSIFGSVASVLTIFLLAIVAISLVVGGIGIMNIMFVAVNQRTREIGLRKAVGATNTDILLQFLIEAIFITVLGGIIGIISGILLAFLLSLVLRSFQENWAFYVSVDAIILSCACSLIIGLIFGLYPAWKASKLSPIEALRYE